MSSRQRLIEYHLSRLHDKRASVRIDAIRELELLGAAEALEPLRTIFEQDEDADVRKAAQLAGRAIFRMQKSSGNSE